MNDDVASITTERAPTPRAAYSQAHRRGNLLFLSGQVGLDPATQHVSESAGEQTAQALRNLTAVLEEAGSSWQDVASIRVYMTEREHYGEMNEVYETFVREPYPARTTVYCGLNPGYLVEIDLIAVL